VASLSDYLQGKQVLLLLVLDGCEHLADRPFRDGVFHGCASYPEPPLRQCGQARFGGSPRNP
jgi:hypothetical protein